MSSKRLNLLLWHKLLFLLIGSMIVLAIGLAFATWQSSGQASQQIGIDGKNILSTQTETFLTKLVAGQADTLDLQLGQARAAAAYGAILVSGGLQETDLILAKLAEEIFPVLIARANNSTNVYYVTTTGEQLVYPPLDEELELPPDFNLTSEPFFPTPADFEGQDEQITWSQVHVNPFVVEHDLVVDAIAPVVVDEVTYGYIGVSVSLNQLIAQFNQRQPIRGSYSFLIDNKRQLVAAPPHARVDLSPATVPVTKEIIDLANTGNADLDTILQNMVLGWASLSQAVIKGEPKYVAYQPLNNIDWRLGVVVPIPVATAASVQLIEVVDAASQQALSRMLIWTGGILVVALVVGGFLTRRLISPLQDMVTVTESIAGSDLEQRVVVTRRDEIGNLANAFNIMADQLQTLISGLEQRVADRTRRLEIVATLGERLNSILNLEELLPQVVDQIKENFDYYHAHIYLFDEQRKRLVVAAGTGQAGAEMKIQGHSIALDAPTSLVARAARTGQIVRVDNVREAEDWLPNPLLPDTYSEMAVPIGLEEEVAGVLDVQENRIAGLDESDANLLRSLAGHVAVAIRNARLFQKVEAALAEAHEAQQRYVEQAWDRTRLARRGVGRVQFNLTEVTTLPEAAIVAARQQALAHARPVVVALPAGQQGSNEVGEQGSDGDDRPANPLHAPRSTPHALVAPIMVQNVPIGDLQLHGIEPERSWSEGELALIEAVVDQVAQAAENLRLFEETRERASRERLIGQVSNKLRRAPDIDTLMKTAVEELARVLGPERAFIRFGAEAELGVVPGNGANNGEEVGQIEEL